MFLPTLKTTQAATQPLAAAFLGLNRSDDRKAGEFAAQSNLSNRRYPYLAPRLPREKQTYTDPCALFAWDGKEILVEEGQLYYDGEALCNVPAGPKQFAVVNTKLLVWPDMLLVDLTNKEVVQMAQSVTNNAEVVFTTNSVKLAARTVYATGGATYVDSDGYKGPWVWTYGAVDWTEAGGWVLTDPQLTCMFHGVSGSPDPRGRYYIPTVTWNESTQKYTMDAPVKEVWSEKQPSASTYPEPEPANNLGFFSEIQYKPGDEDYETGIYGSRAPCIFYHYYAPQVNKADLAQIYKAGEYLAVSGAAKKANNQGKLKITAVTADTITVEGKPFTAGTDTGAVTLRRDMPSLDYICESENRLWGVSNTDKTIYASALGDPMTWYDYSGEDTDSYAVAVGSEGPFTAICAYDGSVLCWKERTLHKMLGAFPSSYQMVTYHFAGVREGAHKSLLNMSEALYYLGPDGVYTYSGNVPTLISRALGTDTLKDGVAGTDGRAYYLSVLNGEGWELLRYDSHTGLWNREDAVQVVDFCWVDDKVKFLSGDGVYTIGAGDEIVEWEGTLAPFHESLRDRTYYGRLLLRSEVPEGSWLAVDIRYDGGRWLKAGLVTGRRDKTFWLPIPLCRCDRFEIRLRGRGECLVLELLREYQTRGKP